jgi:cholesterol oxidase
MERLGRSVGELRESYDVVIVGSGYGGAVCASRLARAGRSVCVLERGREVRPGELPTDTTSFLRASQLEHPNGRVGDRSALFRFVVDDDCGAAMGCALGGTSLINAGVALRPDDGVWEEERWPAALRADDHRLLRDGFDRAEAMLRPTPYPTTMPRLAKLDALEAAARSMGMIGRFSRPSLTIAFTAGRNAAGIEQPACALCGDCLSGCNTGAKTTLLTTYLPDAAAHGAELFTEMDVRFVGRADEASTRATDAAAGWAVHFEPLALERHRFDAPPMFVRAGIVILAAGAFGSTEILLRSRAEGLAVSRALGHRFSGNGTTLAFGYDNACDVQAVGAPRGAVVGPAIAGMIDVRDGEKMVIQESSVPRPLAAGLGAVLRMTRSPGRGPASAEGLGAAVERLSAAFRSLSGDAIGRTQCYAVTARDDSGGRLELDGERLRLRWPGAGLQPIVAAIHERIAGVTAALGGRFVPNPAWANLRSHPPITTHPLGGCAMAEDGARGVVDHRGAVFDGEGSLTYDGLYVCDGSILPGALGYNPLLTIAALAERTALLLARERGWTIREGARTPSPSAPPSPSPSQSPSPSPSPPMGAASTASPRGLRFTERMSGYLRLGDTASPPAPPLARGLDATDFSFVCTLVWADLDALVADPGVHARSFGTALAPALSPHALRVLDGRFRLLVPHEDGTLRMTHRLLIEDRAGARYFVDGYKTIDAVKGSGVWPDTTTLFFTLHRGESACAPRIGHGAVDVTLRDLVSQVSTMTGGSRVRFLRSFATRMRDVYGTFFGGLDGLGGAQ